MMIMKSSSEEIGVSFCSHTENITRERRQSEELECWGSFVFNRSHREINKTEWTIFDELGLKRDHSHWQTNSKELHAEMYKSVHQLDILFIRRSSFAGAVPRLRLETRFLSLVLPPMAHPERDRHLPKDWPRHTRVRSNAIQWRPCSHSVEDWSLDVRQRFLSRCLYSLLDRNHCLLRHYQLYEERTQIVNPFDRREDSWYTYSIKGRLSDSANSMWYFVSFSPSSTDDVCWA